MLRNYSILWVRFWYEVSRAAQFLHTLGVFINSSQFMLRCLVV